MARKIKKADPVDIDLVQRVWHNTRRVSYLMQVLRELEIKKHDITIIQLFVIGMIETSEEPITAAKIADYLFRKPHTVSGLIKRLEQKGLIKRSATIAKGGPLHLELTEKGKRVYDDSRKYEHLIKVYSAISPGKLKELDAILSDLIESWKYTYRNLRVHELML
ncbi:MarR family winged helix-turn-helix transcriptional regulator [Chloroflexota bacterium]